MKKIKHSLNVIQNLIIINLIPVFSIVLNLELISSFCNNDLTKERLNLDAHRHNNEVLIVESKPGCIILQQNEY